MKQKIKDELKKRLPSLLALWSEADDTLECTFCNAIVYAGDMFEAGYRVSELSSHVKHDADCFGLKLLAELSV